MAKLVRESATEHTANFIFFFMFFFFLEKQYFKNFHVSCLKLVPPDA
jgi:hypothetical protein